MTKISRDTYAALSNKLTKSTPSQFWIQRFVDRTTITIYPTANSTAADNYISIYYVARLQDVGAYTNAADAPPQKQNSPSPGANISRCKHPWAFQQQEQEKEGASTHPTAWKGDDPR